MAQPPDGSKFAGLARPGGLELLSELWAAPRPAGHAAWRGQEPVRAQGRGEVVPRPRLQGLRGTHSLRPVPRVSSHPQLVPLSLGASRKPLPSTCPSSALC